VQRSYEGLGKRRFLQKFGMTHVSAFCLLPLPDLYYTLFMAELFHISDDPTIKLFEPRAANKNSGREGELLVWAIEDKTLHNYLLPRDCPRVTFYAGTQSKREDIEKLMGQTSAKFVIAIETAWFERAVMTKLYQYTFAADTFELSDEAAGYYVSRVPVKPISVKTVKQPLEEMLRRNVELRVMPSLKKVQEAVIGSSLEFSCIRMRNAKEQVVTTT
jgi:hypothetical protein